MANSSDEPSAIEPIRNRNERVGRNDPCPCGSGKKFKNCCMKRPGGGSNVPGGANPMGKRPKILDEDDEHSSRVLMAQSLKPMKWRASRAFFYRMMRAISPARRST